MLVSFIFDLIDDCLIATKHLKNIGFNPFLLESNSQVMIDQFDRNSIFEKIQEIDNYLIKNIERKYSVKINL
jgi:hypothetical protein